MAKENKVEVQKGPIQPQQPNPYKNLHRSEIDRADYQDRTERRRGQLFEERPMMPKK